MDTVLTACSHCGMQYRVKGENVGRKAKCAKCGEAFVISIMKGGPPPVPQRDSPALVACRFCGFQDSGNFCSNCGGRLTGQPVFDFDACKIPQTYLSRFPAGLNYDFEASPQKQEQERRGYEIRQRCEQFNEQLDELARAVKYQGADVADWHFDRLSIGRLVDSMPPDVPGRESIVSRLWTMVSDIERAAAKRDVDEQTEKVRQALQTGGVKNAEKALTKLRELITEHPNSGAPEMIVEFESAIKELEAAKTDDQQLSAFQKLLDKADRLAFQQESKKAAKAYQDCLFWLSRNELPDKGSVQSEIEQKLRTLQADASQ